MASRPNIHCFALINVIARYAANYLVSSEPLEVFPSFFDKFAWDPRENSRIGFVEIIDGSTIDMV